MAEEQSVLNDALAKAKSEDKKPEEEKTEEQEQPATEEEKKEDRKPEEEKPEEQKPEEQEQSAPEKEEAGKETKKQPARMPKRAEDNVVLVGKKPTMSYVLATVTQFSDGMDNVHIKARGRSISRAVDVAEVVKNRFVQGVKTNVEIGTEEIVDENNNKINVSTIDIGLDK